MRKSKGKSYNDVWARIWHLLYFSPRLEYITIFFVFLFALSWSYVGQLADHHSQAVGISAQSLSSADLMHITGIVFNVNDVAVMRSH